MYETTNEWDLYLKGKNYLNKKNIYQNTDKCYRFYNGDQWKGLESGAISPIVYNIIKPIVKYKIGVINSNGYSIVFSPNNFDSPIFQNKMTSLCKRLNEYVSIVWENKKFDLMCRAIAKDACINSEGIMYINYNEEDSEVEPEIINKTNIYYSNENDSDIQSQDYILITNRKSVSSVKNLARDNMLLGKNSLTEQDIENIIGDNDNIEQSGDDAKDELNHMILVVTKFYKKDGYVHIKRSIKDMVIEEDRNLGLKNYPIAHFVWEETKGSARGIGEVLYNIPNQIEINKTATRRAVAVMMGAYPKMIVDEGKIANGKDLTKAGAVIKIKGATVDDVNKVIGYLNPTMMSSDSITLQNELMNNTKDLAGAGDALTGEIDPTKASGKAIIAVQQASEQTLTEQLVSFKGFIEQIGKIIFEMWQAYTSDDGKQILYKSEKEFTDEDGILHEKGSIISETIDQTTIQKLKASVKIDVCPNGAFDKYARESALENLMTNGIITFEEYANNLPTDSNADKTMLMNIVKSRKAEQEKINQAEIEGINEQAKTDAMISLANMEDEAINKMI